MCLQEGLSKLNSCANSDSNTGNDWWSLIIYSHLLMVTTVFSWEHGYFEYVRFSYKLDNPQYQFLVKALKVDMCANSGCCLKETKVSTFANYCCLEFKLMIGVQETIFE